MSLKNFPSFFLNFSEAHMDGKTGHSYQFGRFTLDLSERRLLDLDIPRPLTPKAFDVLSILVERAGHLVEKDELMKQVWPDSIVEEANVARIIHTLRRTFGDDGNGNSFIETVPTKGYRFVAPVETVERAAAKIPAGDTEPVAAASIPVTLATEQPSTETNSKRHYFVLAAIVILGLLVTGFWVSNGSLMPRTLARLNGHSINGEAYRHFQEGKLLLEVRSKENYKTAFEHFDRAVELDPEYAEAYAGKADAKSYQFLGSSLNDDIASSRGFVKKALELDPNNSYAHTINCRIMSTYDWDFDEAVTECQRAIALGPNDDGAHRELGFALGAVGRADEAISEMQAAVSLSPTSFNKRSTGMMFYMSRRYDEAIEQLEQVDTTDPGTTDVTRWLMSCFAMKGDQNNAFEQLVKTQEAAGTSPEDVASLRAVFASGGWLSALRTSLDISSRLGKKRAFLTADMLAQIGEKDKAFEVLNEIHDRRAIMLIYVAREPLLDPLRDDPRYSAILSQMNLK